MDVLQVIKEDHDAIRRSIDELLTASKVTDRRKVFATLQKSVSDRLVLEERYLYPEIHGLFAEADVFTTLAAGNHKIIRRHLSGLNQLLSKPVAAVSAASLTKKISELKDLAERHLETVERVLMPKMRQLIPTVDREDLGQAFIDIKAELRNGTLKPLPTRKAAVKAKKRA